MNPPKADTATLTRDEMLALLKSIDEPIVEELGYCIAGRDVQVATKDGVGTRCIQEEPAEDEEDEEQSPEQYARDLAQCLDDFQEWDEMDDEELAGWVEELHLERKALPKPHRKRR